MKFSKLLSQLCKGRLSSRRPLSTSINAFIVSSANHGKGCFFNDLPAARKVFPIVREFLPEGMAFLKYSHARLRHPH
jgi:hypothetical protein